LAGLSYENLFRIIIMRFIDAYDFDVRAIKKSCVHIVHKRDRIIALYYGAAALLLLSGISCGSGTAFL
jgi:hypothetical protein